VWRRLCDYNKYRQNNQKPPAEQTVFHYYVGHNRVAKLIRTQPGSNYPVAFTMTGHGELSDWQGADSVAAAEAVILSWHPKAIALNEKEVNRMFWESV
jgi:hypothetical protein